MNILKIYVTVNVGQEKRNVRGIRKDFSSTSYTTSLGNIFSLKKLSVAVVNKASRADCASCFTLLESTQIACSKKACYRVKNCITEILLRALKLRSRTISTP